MPRRHPHLSQRRPPRPFKPGAWVLLLIVLLVLIVARIRTPQESAPEPSAEGWQRVVRVIDGDTFDLDDGRRVRLLGVDTPETQYSPRAQIEGRSDPYAEEATAFVRRQVEGKKVRLEYGPETSDAYGRTLAYVWLEDETLLNAELLRSGYARALRRFPHPRREAFLELEEEARAARRGLWEQEPVLLR